MALFGHGRLAVPSSTGTTYVDVRVARTPLARERGLQGVTRLRANEGMLFIFPRDHHWAMWMRATPLPLDMIFANLHGQVATIVHGARPFSEAAIVPPLPARYVLEVPAGFADRHGVAIGTTLRRIV